MKRYHKSKNLFDKDNFPFGTSTTIVYTPIAVENGTYTLSTDFPHNSANDVFFLPGNASSGAETETNGVDIDTSRTVTTNNGYITIAARYNSNRQNPANYNYMLNAGDTALPFEPYFNGWETKSPLRCNKTKNLFDISTATLGKWINSAGEEKTSSVPTQEYKLNHTDYIVVEPDVEYTFSYDGDFSVASTVAMCWFNSNKEIVAKNDYPTSGQKVYSFSAVAPSDAKYCIVNFTGYNGTGRSDIMFNAGPMIPYEPYLIWARKEPKKLEE